MVRYKLLICFLFWLVTLTQCEDVQKQIDDRLDKENKPPDKVILRKSEPYIHDRKDNQSLLSKVASWIFPNKRDSVAAETSYASRQYLPAPYRQDDRDCNLCNLEPWIPILGHNKINPIPNKDFSSLYSNVHSIDSSIVSFSPNNEFINPPNAHYGPPPPKPDYGPPPKPYYGPTNAEYAPTINNFGFPGTGGDIFVADYMLPPPLNFKLPPVLYGPPPKDNHGPPKPNYGPPKPNYGPPKPNYGQPKPNYGPPKPNYGPPKPIYGPPNTNFSPPNTNYGPPNINYGPPNINYGPPNTNYGPPNINYGPPNTNYGPPIPPQVLHGPPKSQNDPPVFLITPTQDIKSTILQPVPSGFGSDLVPPPPSSTADNFPPGPQQPNIYNLQDIPAQHLDNSHSLSNIPLDSNYIPPPVPSDSYGNPVTGDHLNQPFDSLPAPSGDSDDYVGQRLPNLNPLPVLPKYEYVDFHQGQHSGADNVQVQQSVNVADYLASIEHPINVIQSPLIEVEVNDDQEYVGYNRISKTQHDDYKKGGYSPNNIENIKLSENPIYVDDIHTAASNLNGTVASPNKRNNDQDLSMNTINKEQILQNFLIQQGLVGNTQLVPVTNEKRDFNKNTTFKSPSLDYNDWKPQYQQPNMLPPSLQTEPTWVTKNTQKTKQIIVPYTNNKYHKTHDNVKSILDSYTTLVPVYTPPMPTEQSDWSKYLNDIETTRLTRVPGKPFSSSSTAVYNINDLIASNSPSRGSSAKLPYDIITLQKSIDKWTQQSYFKGKLDDSAPPKQIPGDYLTTKTTKQDTTPSNYIFDHHLAESSRKETISDDSDINSNLIIAADSRASESTNSSKQSSGKDLRSSWGTAHVTVSPHTKEKVYVVTPQAYSFVTASPAISWSMAPRVQNGTENNVTLESHKFSVRIEPENRESRQKDLGNITNLKVVYSEWPHLINDLQTTTSKPTSAHPLFGLMGISAYTPPANSTVETFLGHSKVMTVVTPSDDSTKSPATKTSVSKD